MVTALAAALALAGCADDPARLAASEADDLSRALAGRAPGREVDCIDADASGPQVIGGTLLYRDGGKLWRNDVIGTCPSLQGDPLIVAEVYGSRLCRNDRVRAVPRTGGIPGPECRLGRFTPYTRLRD